MNTESMPAEVAVISSPLLCADEQVTILKMAREKLRDHERDYRKSADDWYAMGARETAAMRCAKADALNEAVRVLLAIEANYQNAKHATYA
jgi:hypothetical protein